MENRLSHAPTLPSAGAVAFACLLFAAPPQMARAHGDAAWIMQDPGYRTANGSHCCGPTDCERVPDGEVVEMAPPEEFFANPKSDRTKHFLSQILNH